MLLHSEQRLPVWLAVGILSVGGIILFKFLKKRKRRCLSWRGTPIYVCSTADDWVKNEKYFLNAMYKTRVIGLDCEWVSKGGKRSPVSLLQIAASSEVSVVLRMTSLAEEPALPSTLVHLLEDSRVLKVGVEISEDVKKLFMDYGILVKGFCDLRFIADNIPEFLDVNTKSLKDMARNVVGIELIKSSRLRCSNWEAKTLSEEQISYAAGDAVVATCIFDAFIEKISRSTGKSCKFASLDDEQQQLITKFADLPYSSRASSPGKTNVQVNSHSNSTANRKTSKAHLPVRQRPLYDNCSLLAPDGAHLCICKLQKIRWYEKKGLGEIICEDPLTLQLKFEPADRPRLDKEYYTFEKDNCCVVCGSAKNLLKKCVVPGEYRRFFPEMMKSHLSHDVLLLCVPCHQRSNVRELILRNQLATECNAPLGSATNSRKKVNPGLGKVRSAARAILHNKEKLPSERLQELEKTVKDYFNVTEVTPDIILMASDLDTSYINDGYVAHGEKVVQHMCLHGGLLAFERRWRQHFLDTMKPQFLPKMWSVTHGHAWLALKVIEGNIDFDPAVLGLTEEQLETACLNKTLIDGQRNASISA